MSDACHRQVCFGIMTDVRAANELRQGAVVAHKHVQMTGSTAFMLRDEEVLCCVP